MTEKSTPDAKIVFRLLDGSELTEDKIISFNFVKEFYTPYTSFSARYIAQNLSPENFSEAKRSCPLLATCPQANAPDSARLSGT